MATAPWPTPGTTPPSSSEGIVGWEEEGLPLAPEDGYVAESGEAAAVLEARKKA